MNKEKIIALLILTIYVVSVFIIVNYSNWETALGVFLFVTANNIERRNKI